MTADVDLRVPLRDCTPWCEDGDRHADEHPEDRSCWSEFSRVALSNHKPIKMDDGTYWSSFVSVYLRREVGADEPLIYVHSEETDKELRFTIGEANQLAATLLQLIETHCAATDVD